MNPPPRCTARTGVAAGRAVPGCTDCMGFFAACAVMGRTPRTGGCEVVPCRIVMGCTGRNECIAFISVTGGTGCLAVAGFKDFTGGNAFASFTGSIARTGFTAQRKHPAGLFPYPVTYWHSLAACGSCPLRVFAVILHPEQVP